MTADAKQEDEPLGFEEEELARMQERVGLTVGGKYKIVRALGVGGMGGVYEAEHELIGKKVALKCLHREFARERDLVERFKREARAATMIGHENIVDVTDMGDLPDGAPFLVMEVLRGQALASLMDAAGPLPIGRTSKIIRQVCAALQAAHDKGIVHRDMKPENVFLTMRGGDPDFVKVLDFGISKMHEHGKNDRGLTRTGVAMGTPSYMSPEQAQGSKDVDHRTDVWAVGVMLYEMLAGCRPFEADSYPMMLMAIVGRDPENVRHHRRDVPEALDNVVMRCLEKPMGTRVQTMRELGDALLPFVGMNGEPQLTTETPDRRSVATSAPRRKATEAAGGDGERHRLGVAGTTPSAPPAAGDGAGTQRTPTPVTRVAGSTPVATKSAGKPDALSSGTFAGGIGERSASERPPARDAGASERPPASARVPQVTGTLGTAERDLPRSTRERTSAMGSTDASPMDDAPTVAPSRTPMVAAVAAAVLALGVGGAWAAGLFGGAADPAPTPPVVATPDPPVTPPVTSPPVTPPALVEPPAPAEVHVDISTNPPNATVEIGGVTFPNPLSAARPRSLDPVTIRVSLDGYQTIERLVILDQARSFYFELARGRGVRLEDAEGRVRVPHEGHTTPPAETHETHETHETPPASSGSSGGSSGGDDFREEF